MTLSYFSLRVCTDPKNGCRRYKRRRNEKFVKHGLCVRRATRCNDNCVLFNFVIFFSFFFYATGDTFYGNVRTLEELNETVHAYPSATGTWRYRYVTSRRAV